MKSKIIILSAAVICGIFLYGAKKWQGFAEGRKLNDIALANINALTGGEDSLSDPYNEEQFISPITYDNYKFFGTGAFG